MDERADAAHGYDIQRHGTIVNTLAGGCDVSETITAIRDGEGTSPVG